MEKAYLSMMLIREVDRISFLIKEKKESYDELVDLCYILINNSLIYNKIEDETQEYFINNINYEYHLCKIIINSTSETQKNKEFFSTSTEEIMDNNKNCDICNFFSPQIGSSYESIIENLINRKKVIKTVNQNLFICEKNFKVHICDENCIGIVDSSRQQISIICPISNTIKDSTPILDKDPQMHTPVSDHVDIMTNSYKCSNKNFELKYYKEEYSIDVFQHNYNEHLKDIRCLIYFFESLKMINYDSFDTLYNNNNNNKQEKYLNNDTNFLKNKILLEKYEQIEQENKRFGSSNGSSNNNNNRSNSNNKNKRKSNITESILKKNITTTKIINYIITKLNLISEYLFTFSQFNKYFIEDTMKFFKKLRSLENNSKEKKVLDLDLDLKKIKLFEDFFDLICNNKYLNNNTNYNNKLRQKEKREKNNMITIELIIYSILKDTSSKKNKIKLVLAIGNKILLNNQKKIYKQKTIYEKVLTALTYSTQITTEIKKYIPIESIELNYLKIDKFSKKITNYLFYLKNKESQLINTENGNSNNKNNDDNNNKKNKKKKKKFLQIFLVLKNQFLLF